MPLFLAQRYRFAHWLLRWVSDQEGDIGLCIAGLVTFLKYKEHTLVYLSGTGRWRRCKFRPAGKYQGEAAQGACRG